MNKKEIKKIKEQLYYLDSEFYSYHDIDNLKEYAKNLEQENQQLKKQKDNVVEYIKHYINFRKDIYPYIDMREFDLDKLLRMLGEIDELD